MSTVIRPKGPLSPRVYWTRRLFLVVAVMVAAAVLWWVMPGVGGSGNASAGPGDGQQAGHHQPSTTPSSTAQSTNGEPGQGPAVTHHPTPHHSSPDPTHGQPTQGQPTPGQPTDGQPTQQPPKHRPLPPPSGPCDASELTMAVVVRDAVKGAGTTVGLKMSTVTGSPCSLGITPSLLETRITSGEAVIWQSGSCPDALPVKNVVVRPRPTVVYSYAWDGQLNPDSCSATNRIADEGYYWAEAALIGGEPARTQFHITG